MVDKKENDRKEIRKKACKCRENNGKDTHMEFGVHHQR